MHHHNEYGFLHSQFYCLQTNSRLECQIVHTARHGTTYINQKVCQTRNDRTCYVVAVYNNKFIYTHIYICEHKLDELQSYCWQPARGLVSRLNTPPTLHDMERVMEQCTRRISKPCNELFLSVVFSNGTLNVWVLASV